MDWALKFMMLDLNPVLVDKAILLYELFKAKHGIIILGDANSGKSTIVKLLENAINKSSLNEMQVLMEEKKREKLGKISIDEYDEILAISKPVRPDTVNTDSTNLPQG